MRKDQRTTDPSTQRQRRRVNHDGQLATTQTDTVSQEPLPPVITAMVATQTRATLPPHALSIINEVNEANQQQRQSPADPLYHIHLKNTSLSIGPNTSSIISSNYPPTNTKISTVGAAQLRPQTQNDEVYSHSGNYSISNVGDFYDNDQIRTSAPARKPTRGGGRDRGGSSTRRDVGTSSSSIRTDFDPFTLSSQYPQVDSFERLVNQLDEMLVSEDDERKREIAELKKDLTRGLECLFDVDHFFVQPGYSDDFADALTSLRNKYDVLDSHGQRIYYVGEFWDATQNKKLCTATPKFFLKLFDYKCVEVMTVEGKCGRAELILGSDSIGYVEGHNHCCTRFSDFILQDEDGLPIYKLIHEIGSEESYSYEVFDKDSEVIGRISKLWSGLDVTEPSLAYSYGINFPADLPAKHKVILLSALFVLYFKFVADPYRDVRAEKCAWYGSLCCILITLVVIIGFSFLAAYLFTR